MIWASMTPMPYPLALSLTRSAALIMLSMLTVLSLLPLLPRPLPGTASTPWASATPPLTPRNWKRLHTYHARYAATAALQAQVPDPPRSE